MFIAKSSIAKDERENEHSALQSSDLLDSLSPRNLVLTTPQVRKKNLPKSGSGRKTEEKRKLGSSTKVRRDPNSLSKRDWGFAAITMELPRTYAVHLQKRHSVPPEVAIMYILQTPTPFLIAAKRLSLI